MTEPILTLSGISKSFPGVRALHDVSLELYPGQVTAPGLVATWKRVPRPRGSRLCIRKAPQHEGYLRCPEALMVRWERSDPRTTRAWHSAPTSLELP